MKKEQLELLLAKEIIKNSILEMALKEIEGFEVQTQMDAFRMKNVATAALKEINNV